MYRVRVRIEKVPFEVGEEAAVDITEGFKARPWHGVATCVYEDGGLTFTSINDFDENGVATLDELGDEFCANVREYENSGGMRVISVETLPDES